MKVAKIQSQLKKDLEALDKLADFWIMDQTETTFEDGAELLNDNESFARKRIDQPAWLFSDM